MKRNGLCFVRIASIAFIAGIALVLGLAGCGDSAGSGGPGGGGRIDAALVGKWYGSQEGADMDSIIYYEFTSDGYIVLAGSSMGITYTASGGIITTYQAVTDMAGTIEYSISGTVLTLANPRGNSFLTTMKLYKKSSGYTGLSAPENVSATADSASRITITWSAVTYADYYRVYRYSEDSGTYTHRGTATSTSYIDYGLSENTTYSYQVSAYDAVAGESPQSSPASATTDSADANNGGNNGNGGNSGGNDDASDFIYYNSGRGVEIADYTGSSTNVTIPAQINGKAVASIGQMAFYEKGLTSVTIPDSVTSIGDYAFSGNNLTSVTIPDSVTSIGDYAFSGNNLTSVTIPTSVISIGYNAFSYNNLTGIIIPDSVTSIGVGAFSFNSLTSVTIPNSLTFIEVSAFSYNSLTSITIPDSVTSIWGGAFYGNSLTGVTIPDSVTAIGEHAFSSNNLTSVIIPDSVTSIERAAFAGNNLTNITIPAGVTFIEDGTFSNNSLTSVTIPDSVTFIGDHAFSNNNLTSVTIGANVKMDSYGYSFDNGNYFGTCYSENSRSAGTYTRPDVSSPWSKL